MAKKLLLVGVCAAAATSAIAQQGGTTLEFGVSTGIRLEDNWLMIASPSDSSAQISTELTFSATSETRTQRIQFNTGLELHYTDIADSALSRGIADPFANVSYKAFGPGSELSLGASVSVADRELDFSDSDGTAINTGLNAGYTFGSEAPFGGSVSISSDQTRYDDGATDDDDQTNSLALSLRFNVSPALSISPFVSQTNYDVTTGATSYADTRNVGISASATLSEVAVLSASVAQTRIDDNGTVSESTTGDVTATLQGQNGSNPVRHES